MGADKSFFSGIKSVVKEWLGVTDQPKINAEFPTNGTYRTLFAVGYDGEKNLGEMGPIKAYYMDYPALSYRAWQAYIDSPEAQMVIGKFVEWVIGKGLKLQCEPVKSLISDNKDVKSFTDSVEARFGVYAKSKMCDFSGMNNLNIIANDTYKNAINGGDVLVVMRFIDKCVKIELIDGAHVVSPTYGSEIFAQVLANGNKIVNGIELSPTKEHVAYYVRKERDNLTLKPSIGLEVERIAAKGKKSGLTTAFLVYGLKYRLDNHRGIPIVSVVLEKLKKLERYESATLAGAEEQSKIAYQVVHQLGGTGEFPLSRQVAAAHDLDIRTDLPDDTGRELANKVAATTNKMAVNNPQGAEIKPLRENKGILYFKDFYGIEFDIICSCVGIPPNVAASKYDSNYSASRAAIKDWEHTLDVRRTNFAFQFYQNIYNFWLECEVLMNNIQAPGYLIARSKDDYVIVEAYRTTRFIGAPVANIDPYKEVQAERLKLGLSGESLPLTTLEAATEILNGGDSDHNMEQYSDELQRSKDLGIKPEPEVKQTTTASQ